MYEFSENQRKIALLLQNSPGITLSGSLLAEKTGISRQAVSKNILLLKKSGFPVSSRDRQGYSLDPEADTLHPLVLEHELPRKNPPVRIEHLETVESTQKILKEHARQGWPEGSLVLAEEQTSGKGRRSRTWISPPHTGLYLSLLVRPQLPPGHVQLLNLLAGMAVHASIKKCTGISCDLKWPNDVLFQNKKICGILAETVSDSDSIRYAVIGIGINVNTPEEAFSEELRKNTTSLRKIGGRIFSRKQLLLALHNNFMEKYARLLGGEGVCLVKEYELLCATLNKEISVYIHDVLHYGKALGITEEGSLIFQSQGEKQILHSGDIHHLR